MDDKNRIAGSIAGGDGGQSAPSVVVSPDSFNPQALSEMPLASDQSTGFASLQATTRPRLWLRWLMLGGACVVLITFAGYAFYNASKQNDHGATNGKASSRFATTTVDLDNISVEPIVNISNTKTVVINGSLTVKDGLVVAPTVQPATAQAGQIYYDLNKNELAYYNGSEFVYVSGNVVQEINDLTGNIPLGAGLADIGGQLVNTGVLSVQGQRGDVTFSAGNGVAINGTTISNTGVVSVSSSSPTLVVNTDANGNVNLTLNGGGTGTVTSSGGTPDRIAKFTTGQNIEDSLLSESGATVTVNGNLAVTGGLSLSAPLSVANGGTGAATLGANGVLVGNGASAITSVVSGVAGLCLVSTAGAPTWATCNPPSTSVNSLNGLTGTLTIANATGLVDTITIDDASTSNKGIAQFNSTNFSVTGGNVNTVQNISTGSSPTFNTMTLSGNLTVQGGTSTLGTLTQAGSLVVHDGTSNTVTIVAANLSADRVYTLPDAGGDATLCVTAGNCIGGSGSAPNGADYLVTSLNGTLTNERAIANGSNITLTDGGANGNLTVATVQNPTFTTSVTTPALQSSGALVLTSAAGNTVAIDAATTIELQDSTNVTGTLDVSVALNVGTSNAFAVDATGVITAAAGITSSGTIIFSGLNCTGNANGGALTTNGLGQLVCSDDDSGAGGTLTGSGTAGTIPVFDSTTSIANSIITQSGTTITVAGDLVLSTDLTVANGGTGVSSFTSNGVLYGNGSGALQVTAAGTGGQVLIANATGVPTFATFSGDVTVSNTGVTTIQANSVALGTDTTGDYVTNLGTLTGLSATGNSGEGSTPTLSVLYGSIANTAVQGNVTLTCPSGTGNLTGGGTSITLGTGGACGNLTTVNNPTFSTSVTTPNLIFTGAGSNGTVAVGTLGQGTVYTLPDPGQATADICLSVGNCVTAGSAGGDLTGTYPNPTIAKLQGTNLTIASPLAGHVLIYNGTNSAWENHAISSDIAISETGVATIQSNAVALGNDTTGDYVIGLTAGNGVSVTGTSGEGWSPTVAVLYGSTANTAVQGNTGITVSAGTNLTGGGSITLGTGGSVTLNVANSPTFSGSLTVQGGTATVGTATQQGVVVLHDGSSNTGTVQTAALGQDTVYTLPDPGGASASICLTTGNCAGSGGGVTTSGGTTNNLTKFTGPQTIGDSLVTDDGSTVTITGSGNFVVQGGTSTIGTTTQAGTLSISDGSSNTISIVATGVAANRTYTLPDAGGAADFCLSSGNCVGGSGGAPNAADYLVLSLNGTLSNERALTAGSNISFTDGGANSTLTVATVQNPTFTTSVTTPTLQSSGALVLSSGSGTVSVDATTTIELQDSTNVTGSLDVSAALNVGTSNAFAVNSSGAITAATGITSSGTITFSGLNCTTFANGGSVTTDISGVLSCSDDDGAAANTITGTGTSGTVALFNGANTLTDSIITQTGGNTIAIAGTLNLTNDLTVANGGTGASSFTSNGVLYGNGAGAIQVTAAGTGGQVLIANATGVPTFATFSGDVTVSNTGVTTIQANSVALGTDTTGDYVANIGTLAGLSTTGNSGEGSTPTLSVLYGSTASTAVQGNTTLTCPSGTGNLSGGGTSITLGAGGSCGNISIVNNPTFTTSVTTPNLTLTGAGSNGSLVVASLGQGTTYTLPDPGQATASICLSTGNCTAVGTAGGDLTGSYPNPTIAKLQGGTLNISAPTGGHVLVYNSTNSAWENHAVSGDVAISETGAVTIQANSVALGTDTTGDYVANIGSLTGLGTTGNSGEGSTPTLSVLYGSGANTAVQGNVTLTCPSGTGNLSGGGTSITLGAGGSCADITITNSPTFTGTLTVNTITPSSAMTIGSTSQNLTLQGNAITKLTATDSGFTTTVGFTTPTANTTLNFPALAAGTYNICTSSGNCAGAGVTLQTAYNNSATPEITLDATRAALTIRDNSTPLVGNLFEVQNNNGSTTYFAVDNTGISTTGTNTSSGNVNTTGGTIQTNSTNRIANNGDLVNIGNLTATGAITIASTGATNDVIVDGADQFIVQDAAVFNSTIAAASLGSADTATYLCRNSSNQIASCNTTGAGAAFIQGGNLFSATATLGTNDANGLDIRTNSTTRLSIGSGGGVLIQGNATADELEVGDDIFNVNDANSRINLGSTAGDSYLRIGESSLLFGFAGWLNSSNLMRVGTFGSNDLRLETNSAQRILVSGAGVTTISGTGASGVAGFSVDSTQNTATGLQPGNILNATINPGGAASASYFGNQLTVGVGAAGTTFTGDIIANLGQVNWSGASNTSNTGKLYGTVGKVVTSSGAGSVQSAVALFSQLQYAGGTTVTNSYNVYASNLQSGATTNLYGFYAEQMTGGTNNYPLYLASGTANQPLLSVNGTGATTFQNSTNSASALQVQNTIGQNALSIDTTTSNLITNPSVEVNTTGWGAKGSSTISRITTQYYAGNASLQAATTAAAGDGAKYSYTLASSTQYSFSVFVKSSTGFSFNTIEIGRSEDGSTDTSCSTNQAAYGGFARYTCTFTTGAVSGSPYLYVKQLDATARNLWIDGAQLETAASVTRYLEGKTSIGSLAVNAGQSALTSANATMYVQAASGGEGVVVRGNGDGNVFQNAFQVQTSGGTTIFNVNDTSSGVAIQGGNSFLGASALSVVSTDAGARVLEVKAAASQTADIVQVQNSSNTNMFTIGATGAVLSKNTTNSTTAFQIQNAGATPLLTADTANSRVYVGNTTGDTTGSLFVADTKTDIGDPTGVNGAMYYNSSYGRFRCYQNNVWVDCIGGSPKEYLRAEMRTQQTTDKAANDHLKFDTVQASAGGSVSLDTTTTYTSAGGASIGRFTLAAGKTYRLSGQVAWASLTDSAGGMDYSWYNVTGGSQLGSTAGLMPGTTTAPHARASVAEAVFTPAVTTIVELRIVGATSIFEIGYTTSPSLLYPNAYIEVLSDGGSGGASAAEYVRLEAQTEQTSVSSETDDNDHIKFDTVTNRSGSSFSLDTTTAYTEAGGASRGRVTLAAGKTYKLHGTIPYAEYNVASGYLEYTWYNVTAGAVIGSRGSAVSATWSGGNISRDPFADAIFTPSVTTIVELQLIVTGGTVSKIGFNGSVLYPTAYIEVVSDGTKIAQFQGATVSLNGQSGYVPMPTAGQQGSLLLGDGTWSTGVTVLGSSLGIGIASPTSKLHIYEGTTGGASLAMFRDNVNVSAIEILSVGSDTPLIRSGVNDSLNFASNNSSTPQVTIGTGGSVTMQNTVDSTTAFNVKNSLGNSVISIDTTGTNQNNLITNPSFEVSTSGWAAKGAGPTAISRTTSHHYNGAAALQMYANVSGDGTKYNVTLADSTTYSVSFFAKYDTSVDNPYGSGLSAGYASDGSTEANATCGGDIYYGSGIWSSHWTKIECTFTTPASHSGTPYFYIEASSDSGYTYYVDGVLLQTDANADSNYREGKISLQGTVVSPLIVQNETDTESAFAVQNSHGSNVLSVSNYRIGTYNESGVQNSDIEMNTAGWSAVGSGTTISRDPTTAWSGSSSLKISTGTVAGSGAKYVVGPKGADWTDDARITFFVRASTGTITDITASYSWDGNSASEAGDTCSVAPGTVTTAWREVDCWIGSVGAGSPTASAYIIIKQTGTTAHTFYVDAVSWEQDYGDPGPAAYGSGNIMLGGVVITPAMFRNNENSDQAFSIQGVDDNELFRVDTANRRIYVGDPRTSLYSAVLILDGSSSDPSSNGINGAMYYNTTNNRFRCYQNSEWRDCVSSVASNGIGGGSAFPSGTTTSTTYVNVPGGASALSFTKKSANTKLTFQLNMSFYVTVANKASFLAINLDGTDYECMVFWWNVASQHLNLSCNRVITGITAGSKTAQVRWKTDAGGSMTGDSGDRLSLTVLESD